MAKSKVKLQIYVTEEEAKSWRESAANEGTNLSAWVTGHVTNSRTTWRALMNLHAKVDTLVEGAGK